MPTKKKAYCGAGNVPKGRKRGSYSTCKKNNQVRYWGLNTKGSVAARKKKKKTMDSKFNKQADIARKRLASKRKAKAEYRKKTRAKTLYEKAKRITRPSLKMGNPLATASRIGRTAKSIGSSIYRGITNRIRR